jgi:peptidoglycan/LPS O-acetylase OafA/YrhL
MMAWLGLVSYGIYLYHYPIMNKIHFHAGLTASFLLLTLVGGAIAVACAAASYYLVERRALRFKRSGGQAVTASSDGVPEPA